MENNNLRKLLIYMIPSLFIPTVFSFFYEKFVGEAKDVYGVLLYTGMVFLACILLVFLIELTRFLIKIIKAKSCDEVLKNIDNIANSIKLPNGEAMFDIKEQTYALYDSIKGRESWFKRTLHDTHHTIYHSTTAKSHLNWIEYVFWSFLKRLHDELGCNIIISLHYDEKARETGLSDHKEKQRYEALFKCYSHIAKTLIGNDIVVIDERDFRGQRKYAKYYAQDFHDKFVKSILNCVKQITDGSMNYKQFMRKVSYIESVFPIMAYSEKKMRFSRLYVLDRELAQEVWQQSPFYEYKTTNGIFFITAQTIRYENNEPMRIFSPEDTINITDNTLTINQKLKTIDFPTKKIIAQLLISTLNKAEQDVFGQVTEANIDDIIKDVIGEIKNKYKFNESV